MEQTNDGFRIAEEDLAIRGPGDFMGTRQSGLPDFRIASIVRDGRILGSAIINNEECYLISKFARALGVVYLEHQARI